MKLAFCCPLSQFVIKLSVATKNILFFFLQALFCSYLCIPLLIWGSYLPHCGEKSLCTHSSMDRMEDSGSSD